MKTPAVITLIIMGAFLIAAPIASDYLQRAQILEALLHNEQRVLPVSSRLEGYLGIQDVCMSVPSIVNRGGVEAVLELPLNESEREGLKHSADTIRKAIRTLGF